MGIRICGKFLTRRTFVISCRKSRAGAGASAESACRVGGGRRRGAFVSASFRSRLVRISYENRGGNSARFACGEQRKFTHLFRRLRILLFVYVCARRSAYRGLFFFRNRIRKGERLLCGERSRCARFDCGGDIRDCVGERHRDSVSVGKDTAENRRMHPRMPGERISLERTVRQRKSSFFPRTARLCHFSCERFCAFRKKS